MSIICLSSAPRKRTQKKVFPFLPPPLSRKSVSSVLFQGCSFCSSATWVSSKGFLPPSSALSASHCSRRVVWNCVVASGLRKGEIPSLLAPKRVECGGGKRIAKVAGGLSKTDLLSFFFWFGSLPNSALSPFPFLLFPLSPEVVLTQNFS